MERLTIDIPEEKSSLVKQVLKELGVIIEAEKRETISEARKKLANVSVWSDEELKAYEK